MTREGTWDFVALAMGGLEDFAMKSVSVVDTNRRSLFFGRIRKRHEKGSLEGFPGGKVFIRIACGSCGRAVSLDRDQFGACRAEERFPTCLACLYAKSRRNEVPPQACRSLLADLRTVDGVVDGAFAALVAKTIGRKWKLAERVEIPEDLMGDLYELMGDVLHRELPLPGKVVRVVSERTATPAAQADTRGTPEMTRPAETPTPPDIRTLRLDEIRTDGDTQPREGIDTDTVGEYAERMEAGDSFRPLEVVHDGSHYWLWDGFHRYRAGLRAKRVEMACRVSTGTADDARWKSLAANKDHGLRRSNADKRRAVELALKRRPDLSDRAIADHVGVSDKTVGSARRESTRSTQPY